MKKLVTSGLGSLMLLTALCTHPAGAQIPQAASIDSVFAGWDSMETPGAALGVIRDGELVYAKGYGSADLEHDLPITPESVFYIGSVSKQFVTFCILLLEEQGKLRLDDRIQEYLPDFPEYGAPLTIRHFIHHTSGVRDYLTLMDLKGRDYLDHTTPEEVYRLIRRQRELNFTPGERYLYSNSCYFMLAMIVEAASGQTIREYAREHIFEPLGMTQTLFYDDNRDLIKNRVFSYARTDQGFDNLIMRFDLVGSGGIYSSIRDLYLWDQNFYDNQLGAGGQAIIEKMQTDGKLSSGESAGYAFALNIGEYRGLKTVSHGGALAGYRAELMRFPEQRFSVVVLANRDDANPTGKCYRVADILMEDVFKEGEGEAREQQASPAEVSADASAVRPPEFTLGQLAGSYEVEPGLLLEMEVANDTLRVTQNWNGAAYPLVHYSGATYRIPGEALIDFVFSDLQQGQTQVVSVFQNGSETVCRRIERADPAAAELASYAGTYYSEEIDATYQIYQEGDGLKLRIEGAEPREVSFYTADQLTAENLFLRFRREDGEIAGFLLDAGRVQNLRFEKIAVGG